VYCINKNIVGFLFDHPVVDYF